MTEAVKPAMTAADVWTAEDVAAFLRVKRWRVLALARGGAFPSIVMGRDRRFRRVRVAQAKERLLSGRDWRRADLVFCRPDGEPLAHQTVQYLLERACVTAGVRHLSPHSFRRYALTQVEEALGREAAQRLGGHTDPKMTARYVTTTRAMLAQAAEALEAVG